MEIIITKKNGEKKVALFDDSDMAVLSNYRMIVSTGGYVYGYPKTESYKQRRLILIHRMLLGILDSPKILGDHKNRNPLDNRRENIRICNRGQNNTNRLCTSKTGYKGVRMCRNMFQAVIIVNGTEIYLGTFKEAIHATMAYDEAAVKFRGEFACLNFDREGYSSLSKQLPVGYGTCPHDFVRPEIVINRVTRPRKGSYNIKVGDVGQAPKFLTLFE